MILVYRSPNAPAENTEKLCQIIRNLGNNTIVIGDFNFPKINWTTMQADSRGRPLVSAVEEENLAQMVKFSPTPKVMS